MNRYPVWFIESLYLILLGETLLFLIVLCCLIYLLFGIDVAKVYGSLIATGFLGWVAYGQLNIAASQKEISEKQANIAHKKVALDIRDRRYEVFRRWNEAYLSFKDQANVYIPDSQFLEVRNIFLLTSDEMFYIFQNTPVTDMIQNIKSYILIIEKRREKAVQGLNNLLIPGEWTDYYGWRCGDLPPKLEYFSPAYHEYIWYDTKKLYDDKIRKTITTITERRTKIIDQALKEMKIS